MNKLLYFLSVELYFFYYMSSEEEYYEEEYYEESDETKPVPLEYDYGEYLEWLNKHND